MLLMLEELRYVVCPRAVALGPSRWTAEQVFKIRWFRVQFPPLLMLGCRRGRLDTTRSKTVSWTVLAALREKTYLFAARRLKAQQRNVRMMRFGQARVENMAGEGSLNEHEQDSQLLAANRCKCT